MQALRTLQQALGETMFEMTVQETSPKLLKKSDFSRETQWRRFDASYSVPYDENSEKVDHYGALPRGERKFRNLALVFSVPLW